MKFFILFLLINNLHAAAFKKDAIWDHSQIRLCTIPFARYMENWEKEKSTNTPTPSARFMNLITKVKEKTNGDLILKDNHSKIEEIKNIVASSYSKEKTSLEFIQWSECPFSITRDAEVLGERENYDSVLVYFTLDQKVINEYIDVTPEITSAEIHKAFKDFSVYVNIGGSSEIGDISKTEPEKITLMTLRTPLDRQDILHEFGHMAGLVHEQERKDAYRKDKFRDACNKLNEYPEIVRGGRWDNSELRKFKYDAFSIMNYCQNYRERNEGKENQSKLSLEDQMALQKTYRNMPLTRAVLR